MEEFWANIPVATLGPPALLALFVLAVFRGLVVPRSVVNDIRTDRDARIAELVAERDDWKEAYFNSEKSRTILADQNQELIELARTGTAVLNSLPKASSAQGSSEGTDRGA